MIKLLAQFGFERVRQRGSHVVLKKTEDGKSWGCVVPLHKELAPGTMRGILKQARLSAQDFLEVYENRP